MGVIGKAMILTALISEFGLQEKVFTATFTALHPAFKSVADTRLEVVLTLIGRVESSKPCSQGLSHQVLSALFFPSGAVKKLRKLHSRPLLALMRPLLEAIYM